MFDRPGEFLYHYTRLDTALEHILPTQRLRLSPFSAMRDPRESHMWGAAASVPEPAPEDDELFYELSQRMNDVKSTIKVLSLTRDDDPALRSQEHKMFGRGFAHPRLWEQYAENHRGVCLCLEQKSLVRVVKEELGAQGKVTCRAVTYEDGPIAHEALHFDLPEVRSGGVNDAVREHLEKHHEELFFRKARDWESEMEYRVVVATHHPRYLYMNISQALKWVILGAAVPPTYFPAVEALCRRFKVEIAQLCWFNGGPQLLPALGGTRPDQD